MDQARVRSQALGGLAKCTARVPISKHFWVAPKNSLQRGAKCGSRGDEGTVPGNHKVIFHKAFCFWDQVLERLEDVDFDVRLKAAEVRKRLTLTRFPVDLRLLGCFISGML